MTGIYGIIKGLDTVREPLVIAKTLLGSRSLKYMILLK